MADGLAVGDGIQLDGRYDGFLRFKGEVEGRAGVWLGLELVDTVGDCDGTWNGTAYFECSDGCGMFVRENAGRVLPHLTQGTKVEDLNIPPKMLEHMKFLFEHFDEEGNESIDEDQMLRALKTLGGARVTRQTVRSAFTTFDDGDGAMDFVEFCAAVKNQWAHLDLGQVVAVIEEHEAEEARRAEADSRKKDGMVLTDEQLTVRVGKPEGQGPGFNLNLRYFGKGANAFLLFVYGILALIIMWQLYLEIPEDLFNNLLMMTMAGMSALFGVGGFAMHTHNWPTIKVYAVLMFFGAGAQVTFGLMHWAGFFGVTSGTVLSVMDRKCGTCLAQDSTNCNGDSLYDGLTGGDIDYGNMPWYCCCAHNLCRDFSQELASPASCVDGCGMADLTSEDNDASEASCRSIALDLVSDQDWDSPYLACTYTAASPTSCTAVGGGEDAGCAAAMAAAADSRDWQPTCEDAGCQYNRQVRESCRQTVLPGADPVACHGFGSSNSTCREQSSCYYLPAVFGTEPDLNEDETTAKDFCAGNADYQDNLGLGISATSQYGETTCFEKGKVADEPGSLAQCVSHFQETAQSGYIIFILVFCPVQLLAAYIGWVLPDIYFQQKELESERGFDVDPAVRFVNPLDADSEMDVDPPDRIEQMKAVATAQERARLAAKMRQQGLAMDLGELPKSASKKAPVISKDESNRLFIKRGKVLRISLLADGPDDKLGLVMDRKARCPPRIGKITPNGLAHQKKLKAGWAITEVQGKDVEGLGYDECVVAIKNVDFHLGAGLQLKVMLNPGEEFEGEGESVSESDDEDTAEAAEKLVAAQRDKVAMEKAERQKQEKERAAANQKRKIEREKKQKAEQKAKKDAEKKAAKEAEKLKREEEKKAKQAAKEAERLKQEEEKEEKAKEAQDDDNSIDPTAEELAAATRFVNPLDQYVEDFVSLENGGGKRYNVVLPGVIRAGQELTSEKIGNLHPPEEIISLEEVGNRVRFDAHHDCDYPSGWVSKASADGTKLLELIGEVELE